MIWELNLKQAISLKGLPEHESASGFVKGSSERPRSSVEGLCEYDNGIRMNSRTLPKYHLFILILLDATSQLYHFVRHLRKRIHPRLRTPTLDSWMWLWPESPWSAKDAVVVSRYQTFLSSVRSTFIYVNIICMKLQQIVTTTRLETLHHDDLGLSNHDHERYYLMSWK